MTVNVFFGPRMKVQLTRHAETMSVEREIALEWVERTVNAPEVVENDPVQPGASRAFRSIPENGGRVLRVVYVTTVAMWLAC